MARRRIGNLTYAAERQMWRSGKTARLWHTPPATITAQQIADLMNFPSEFQRLRIRYGRTGVSGTYFATHEIVMSSHAPLWVLLHEFAHAAAPKADHDAEFRREYLRIVGFVAGGSYEQRLRNSFDSHGLKVADGLPTTLDTVREKFPALAIDESQFYPYTLTDETRDRISQILSKVR